jgi:di/tricarboxylate transporter
MTPEIIGTLAITLAALGLFIWNRIRVEVVGLMVMAALILSGLVSIREGISGFANEAMLTVGAMFVLSAGLVRTGAIDVLGQWIARLAGKSEFRLLLVSVLLVIPLSAFINNTPVVVVMVPLVLGLSRKIGARPSKLFMPISYGSQLGGTLTLIGTSTNLLVAGLVLELGVERIRLFDITPPATVLMVLGLIYLLTVGRWLTPVREPAFGDLLSAYELREYVSALIVRDDSPLVDRSIGELRFGQTYGLYIVAVDRPDGRISGPGPGTVIHAGDALIVRGRVEDITGIRAKARVEIAAPEKDFGWHEEGVAGEEERRLAEVMVPPRSRVVGRNLRDLNFRGRYGVPVLAIQRHGEPIKQRMRDVLLEPGDLLLVQATPHALRRIHEGHDLALLGPLEVPARRIRKLKFSIPIIAAVVALAAFGIMPILVSALLGTIAMFLTGCVRPEEAYEEVDWMVLILLGSIIPLGIAMQNTGAADFLARQLLVLTLPLGLLGTLAAFYLLTSILTELISNNAAAVVVTPLAVATAVGLDVSPLPFIIAVMIAASNAFMTPIGYQTNTFIYGPGGYRFSDFVIVGGPLNLLMLVAATLVIPFFFPF